MEDLILNGASAHAELMRIDPTYPHTRGGSPKPSCLAHDDCDRDVGPHLYPPLPEIVLHRRREVGYSGQARDTLVDIGYLPVEEPRGLTICEIWRQRERSYQLSWVYS